MAPAGPVPALYCTAQKPHKQQVWVARTHWTNGISGTHLVKSQMQLLPHSCQLTCQEQLPVLQTGCMFVLAILQLHQSVLPGGKQTRHSAWCALTPWSSWQECSYVLLGTRAADSTSVLQSGCFSEVSHFANTRINSAPYLRQGLHCDIVTVEARFCAEEHP